MLKTRSQTNINTVDFHPKFFLSRIFCLKDHRRIANKGKLASVTTKGFIFHLKKKESA